MDNINKIYRRQLHASFRLFTDELSEKLSRYGINNRICLRIARLRLKYAIDLFYENREVCITDIFPLGMSNQRAVNIYNAYIRHYRTEYDDFYYRTVNSVANGVQLEKEMVRHLWRVQKPNEFDIYEKKCIIIDYRGNRIIGGHLTNY